MFASVFLAEIGDKTQLATLLFASNAAGAKWTVFVAAALALVIAAGIGVLAGGALGRYVAPRTLSIAAGIGFVLIGAWMLIGVSRPPS